MEMKDRGEIKGVCKICKQKLKRARKNEPQWREANHKNP